MLSLQFEGSVFCKKKKKQFLRYHSGKESILMYIGGIINNCYLGCSYGMS